MRNIAVGSVVSDGPIGYSTLEFISVHICRKYRILAHGVMHVSFMLLSPPTTLPPCRLTDEGCSHKPHVLAFAVVILYI